MSYVINFFIFLSLFAYFLSVRSRLFLFFKFLPQLFAKFRNSSYLCPKESDVTMKRPEIVSQIQQVIRQTEPTATAILYGSEARGDARADSDVDVLILLDGDRRNLQKEAEISGALYDLELKTGVLISPMIMLRKLWENRPFKTPFYINVMNEGVAL